MSGDSRDQLWATVQAAAATMQGRPSLTIERAPHVSGTDWAAELGKAKVEGLLLHDTLGEGGMGRVHRAQQPTLDREVAVKSLRPDRRTQALTAKILQEAWVLGRLDHPNIVPIHDIVIDAEGDPQIVMKRVVGNPWNEVLDELGLVEHLRIAQQVCNAVAYAHAQGIVHLDLKPENVMVGSFGEVYLMDWGIAMALDERNPRIPKLRDCNEIIGTPSYMAPEMLEGDGAGLGTHTDIYLLGATLFHVVCGRPPHRGETMMEMLYDIVHRDPAVPDGIGPQLAALLRSCLDRAPEQRPPDAQAVATAIDEVLAAQESQRLTEEASVQLERLRARVCEEVSDPDQASQHELAVHDAFVAARFGFELALDRSPGHRRAHQGWLDATETMARWELGRGRHEAAASLMAAAPELPASLREAVEAAAAQARGKADRLAQFERDQNPLIGQRTRLFIISVMGVMWTVLPLAAHYGFSMGPSATAFRTLSFIYLFGLAGLLLWARDSMSKTALNRKIAIGLMGVFVAQALLTQTGVSVGLSGHLVMSMAIFLYCSGSLLFAVFIEKRLAICSAAYGTAFVATLLWPDQLLPILAMANLIFTLTVVFLWWTPVRGPPPA